MAVKMSDTNCLKTFNDFWNEIKKGLDKTYRLQQISRATYMDLYSSVYNVCNIHFSEPPISVNTAENSQAHCKNPILTGERGVYTNIENYLESYLKEIIQNQRDLDTVSLLRYYVDHWKRYQFSSKVTNGFCNWLNRQFIRKARASKENVYEIYTLTMVLWNSEILQPLHERLASACVQLVQAQRENHTIETELIQEFIQSCVDLDSIDKGFLSPSTTQTETKFHIYEECFEKPFLKHIEIYYSNKALNLVQKPSTEYLNEIINFTNQEIHQLSRYLPPSTLDSICNTIHNIFSMQAVDIAAESIIQDENNTDFALLCKLVSQSPNASAKLKNILENHIYEQGENAIKTINPVDTDNPEQYTEKLLNIHDKFLKFIQAATNDKHLISALDNACTKFVNHNIITETAGTTKKSPELLVRYTDLLLRKGTEGLQQTELEEKFNQIMLIFDYINDKDFFQTFYIRLLAKRLIGHLSSLDDEEYMITQIKRKCGTEYTSKVEHMYQDIVLSETIVDQYNTQLGNTEMKDHFDFSVMVLKSNLWRFSLPIDIILPDQLRRKYDSFNKFYTDKHNGRVLTCLYQYSKGDLQTLYTKSKYTLQVSTYQMAILLLFNKYSTITVERIHNETLLPMDSVLQILRNLLKMKLLKCAEMNDDKLQGHIEDSDMKPHYTMEIDESFKSETTEINLNVPLKLDEQKDIKNAHEGVDDDRRLVIQATLVRIMKTRQSLKHGLLLQETIQQLVSRFQPKIPIIKRCIDGLIEREYLRRDAIENDLLHHATWNN